MRRVGLSRAVGAVAAFALTLIVPGAAAGAGPPPLPEEPIPVHVTFAGSGSFNYSNTEGSTAAADDELSWHVEYQAALMPDGTSR